MEKSTLSKPKPSRIVLSVNSLFWYLYLLLVLVMSFANTTINSTFWLIISGSIFVYSGLYCGFSCWFINQRIKALYAARFALFWFVLMLLWMLMQMLVVKESYLEVLVFNQGLRPDWFNYEGLWSVTPQRTMFGLLSNLTVGMLFVLSLLLLDSRRRVKQLMWLFLAVGVIHAVIAIFAKYAGIYFIDKVSLDGHFNAARGLFVNRNHLAAFSVLCLFSAMAMQIKLLLKSKVHNVSGFVLSQLLHWSFLFFVVGIACVFLAESRGALLSLFGCVVLYIGLLFHKSIAFTTSNNRHYYFIFSLLIVGVAVTAFVGQGMVSRFLNDGLALGERSTQWAITWQAIQQELWFGYGVGSYELVFQTFRGYADLRTVIYDQAHNDYLHIFLEQGAIGLVIWISFIMSALVYAIKSYKRASSSLISAVLLSGLIVVSAILMQSLVDYPLQIMTIRCYFFVIIALMFAAPVVRHR